MNANAAADLRGLQKPGGRAVNEIARIHRQRGVAARKFDRAAATFERQPVAKVDRLHDGFEFVKAVGRLPRMFSSRLTLQGEFFFERHGLHENKTRQRKMVGASGKTDSVTVNCRTRGTGCRE
jgi:hypothetical protein